MDDASRLTHRHVEIFRAVMSAGSVTAAAEALFTSQPTISRELSRMESLLRLVLFDRVRGGQRLQAFGGEGGGGGVLEDRHEAMMAREGISVQCFDL